MNKKELIEETRKAIEEFNRLPPEEQVKRLMASGTINEHGVVLLGQKDPRNDDHSKPNPYEAS